MIGKFPRNWAPFPGIPYDEAGGESLLLVELGVEELPDAVLHLLLWQHLWAHQVAPNNGYGLRRCCHDLGSDPMLIGL